MLRLVWSLVVVAVVTTLVTAGGASPAEISRRPIRAVAFDFLALFRADGIADDLERMLPTQGREVAALWRTRQFEYCWLRSLSGRYTDFSRVSEAALNYAAEALHAPLTAEQKQQLLQAYSHLPPWPEAPKVLRALQDSGLRVIGLSNFSPLMLRDNVANAGLTELFEGLISTDERRTYKPDPRAYKLGLEHLHLAREEVLFVASAGWDAAGARSFGYPTFWVNRAGQPAEALGAPADGTGRDLDALVAFVSERNTPRL
jgi:2-haloacid dehalogenase